MLLAREDVHDFGTVRETEFLQRDSHLAGVGQAVAIKPNHRCASELPGVAALHWDEQEFARISAVFRIA